MSSWSQQVDGVRLSKPVNWTAETWKTMYNNYASLCRFVRKTNRLGCPRLDDTLRFSLHETCVLRRVMTTLLPGDGLQY